MKFFGNDGHVGIVGYPGEDIYHNCKKYTGKTLTSANPKCKNTESTNLTGTTVSTLLYSNSSDCSEITISGVPVTDPTKKSAGKYTAATSSITKNRAQPPSNIHFNHDVTESTPEEEDNIYSTPVPGSLKLHPSLPISKK